MATKQPLQLRFTPVKETKGTFKFDEVLPAALSEAKVGTLYVRKSTLAELGWDPSGDLTMTLEAA